MRIVSRRLCPVPADFVCTDAFPLQSMQRYGCARGGREGGREDLTIHSHCISWDLCRADRVHSHHKAYNGSSTFRVDNIDFLYTSSIALVLSTLTDPGSTTVLAKLSALRCSQNIPPVLHVIHLHLNRLCSQAYCGEQTTYAFFHLL